MLGVEAAPRIGNLAFYNGWSPDYIYLKSLLIAGNKFNDTNSWDTKDAEEQASIAINDALAHKYLNGLSENDAAEAMTKKFQDIQKFLAKAYTYEASNEQRYFAQKYKEISEKFTDKERTAIQPLQELLEAFSPKQGETFEYDKIITLINILMQGIKNTATVADHESKHIKNIHDAIYGEKGVLAEYLSQLDGLGRATKLPADKLQKSLEKNEKKKREELRLTYLDQHGFGHVYRGKYQSNIRGIKKHLDFKRNRNSIDVEMAHWVTDGLKEIEKNPKLIKQIAECFNQIDFPKNGKFNDLETPIKSIIINAIQQRSIDDFGVALHKRITPKYAENIVNSILKDPETFKTSVDYDIEGYYNNYGQYGKTYEFLENVTKLSELKESRASEVYEAMDNLKRNLQSKEFSPSEEQTNLYKIFLNNKSWKSIESIITLVRALERKQKQLNKLQRELNEQRRKAENIIGKQTEVKIGTQKITFTLDIAEDVQTHVKKIVFKSDQDNKSVIGSQMSAVQAFQELGFKTFNPTSLSGAIKTIKKRASEVLKIKLIDSIQAALDRGIKEEALMKIVTQGLQNLQISVGGPKLSEITSAIQFKYNGKHLSVNWAGGQDGKNDIITISIDDSRVFSSLKFEPDDKMTQIIGPYLQQHIEEAREDFIKQLNANFEKSVAKETSKDVNKYTHQAKLFRALKDSDNMDTKLAEKYQELQKDWKIIEDRMNQNNIDEKKQNEVKERFFSFLKDTIYISTTVKTYNDYSNNFGFLGGSIGGDFDAQMSRISELFKLAGLSIDGDLKWLKFAILNCTPHSILGTDNKNLIENYIGAVAAMALFDEGGAEGEIVKELTWDVDNLLKNETKDMNILHLYRVNGIYVPGSYVLKQVYDSITNEVIPNVLKVPEIMKTGAGITIINNVSESHLTIPNRPMKETTSWNANAWKATGASAKGYVKIQILFLAGLLDVVNGINRTLSNIQLI